ncbi:hypothetical protein IW256_007021 [Actinomadura viridis]|uniref:Uncharacterized protein n=1 Tax=Actinomadura viridis TaxID=58110 RepID=A0A931DQI8_9ACTN|nr:hypothetical protein [Actinomadura viridis]
MGFSARLAKTIHNLPSMIYNPANRAMPEKSYL